MVRRSSAGAGSSGAIIRAKTCGALAIALLLGAALAPHDAAADPRGKRDGWNRHHRHDGRHHPHRRHGPDFSVVIRPAPFFHPPPRIYHHHHRRPFRGAATWLHCQPWYGPVWVGHHYTYVHGTICLMPDGHWQLVD